jgi:uncharacterized phage protein (TIGR01671 family)
MRVIKFRAFDTTIKKMFDFESICELYDLEQLYRLTETNDQYTKFMQFTGLQDKNGVDIYEGDLLSWDSADLVMGCKFEIEDCAFTLSNVNGSGGAMMNQDYMLNYKVIGNIHQNPELLEQK